MKIKVLLVFSLLCTSLFGEIDYRYGFSASFGLPFYSGSGFEDYLDEQESSLSANDVTNNPIIGSSIGLIFEVPLNNKFTAHSELNLVGTGGGYVASFDDETSSHLLSEINLELALFIKYYFGSGETQVYLLGGPQQSYLLLSAEYIQDGSAFDKYDGLDYDFFGLAFGAGVGIEFSLVDHRGFIELRFSHEFTDTFGSSGFKQNYGGFFMGIYPSQGVANE